MQGCSFKRSNGRLPLLNSPTFVLQYVHEECVGFVCLSVCRLISRRSVCPSARLPAGVFLCPSVCLSFTYVYVVLRKIRHFFFCLFTNILQTWIYRQSTTIIQLHLSTLWLTKPPYNPPSPTNVSLNKEN